MAGNVKSGAGNRIKGWLSGAVFVAVLLVGPAFAVAGFVMTAQDDGLRHTLGPPTV